MNLAQDRMEIDTEIEVEITDINQPQATIQVPFRLMSRSFLSLKCFFISLEFFLCVNGHKVLFFILCVSALFSFYRQMQVPFQRDMNDLFKSYEN